MLEFFVVLLFNGIECHPSSGLLKTAGYMFSSQRKYFRLYLVDFGDTDDKLHSFPWTSDTGDESYPFTNSLIVYHYQNVLFFRNINSCDKSLLCLLDGEITDDGAGLF